MRAGRRRRLLVLAGAGWAAAVRRARPPPAACVDQRLHLHLTNYVQEGPDIRALPRRSWAREVGRAALFGIPLQQEWSYRVVGRLRARPTTSIPTPRSTTTRSPTPTSPWPTGRCQGAAGALRSDDHRLQPGGHVRRRSRPAGAARPSRASSPASASSRIHKEFVSSKVAGTVASLTDPALDRLLDFAAEVGLVVLLHNDVDMPFAKPGAEPVYLGQLKALFRRHPRNTIIWAHVGVGPGGSPGREPRRHGASDPRRSRAPPRALRPLLERGRQVPGGQRRRRSSWRPTSSTATPIGSCSAPTRSRPPDRRPTCGSTSSTPRCGAPRPDGQRARSAGATTSACSTRPAAGCAPGNAATAWAATVSRPAPG